MATEDVQLLARIHKEATWGLTSLFLYETQWRPFSNPPHYMACLRASMLEWGVKYPELVIVLCNVEQDARQLNKKIERSTVVIQRAWREGAKRLTE